MMVSSSSTEGVYFDILGLSKRFKMDQKCLPIDVCKHEGLDQAEGEFWTLFLRHGGKFRCRQTKPTSIAAH